MSMSLSTSSIRMTAVALASDEIYEWWLSFIASFRESNPNVPLIVIPYNDNTRKIKSLEDVFGYKMLEADLSAIDTMAEQLFGDLAHKQRLRKLAAFDLPVDQFIYIDVDTLVYIDISNFMAKFAENGADVCYCTISGDTVFNKSGLENKTFRNSKLFSSGLLAVNRNKVSLSEIMKCLDENIEFYKEVRHPNVIDQPILNFCSSLLGWSVVRIDEIDSSIAPHKWYKDSQIEFVGGKPRTTDGRNVPVIHWAGNEKNTNKDPSAHLRTKFVVAAQVKVGRENPDAPDVVSPQYSFNFKDKTISSDSYGRTYLSLFISSIIKHIRPRGGAFLEWGSGLTSILLADLCRAYGASRFITMDTYGEYQRAVEEALPPDIKVDAVIMDVTGPCQNQQDTGLNYSTYPLSTGECCDLVFIDGRRRMECLMASLLLCHEDTIIIIHDYRRTRYQLALAFCDIVENNEQFRIMRIKPGIFSELSKQRDAILSAFKE
ncbi:hypothetical protein [Azospirillum argentinense]